MKATLNCNSEFCCWVKALGTTFSHRAGVNIVCRMFLMLLMKLSCVFVSPLPVIPESPNFPYRRYDRLPPISQFSIESDSDLSETAELIEEYEVFDPSRPRPKVILVIGKHLTPPKNLHHFHALLTVSCPWINAESCFRYIKNNIKAPFIWKQQNMHQPPL